MENLNRKEQGAEFYNLGFNISKYNVGWEEFYLRDVYEYVMSNIMPNEKILEMGCGCGQFAEMLFSYGYGKYLGFDFSDTAIDKCMKRNAGEASKFVNCDIYNLGLFKWYKPDVIVALEVFEHVRDYDVINLLNEYFAGTKLIITVPKGDYIAHLRYFENQQAVLDRYQNVIDIDGVITIGTIYVLVGSIKQG